MSSRRSYKQIIYGVALGVGIAFVMSPTARDKIKQLFLGKSEELLPLIKEEIELYLDRISEAIKSGKAASQQREDELAQIMSPESRRAG